MASKAAAAADGAPPEGPRRRIYPFSRDGSPGTISMKALLGGKGAGLCEMARLNLNVPPGLWEEVEAALKGVEAVAGAKFGDAAEPLLLSVRSGAALSMPGMMDTVLNLGLTDAAAATLAARHGERFALDCQRRLLAMYGEVVLGLGHAPFEAALAGVKAAAGKALDVELDAADLRAVVARFKGVYKDAGVELPTDPREQLKAAIAAVFRSWNTPRAVKYREINRIRERGFLLDRITKTNLETQPTNRPTNQPIIALDSF